MRAVTVAILVSAAALVFADELCLSTPAGGKVDGKTFDYTVSRDDVIGTPIWPQKDEHPPLSPRRAQEIARKELGKLVKNIDEWSLRGIVLFDMGDHLHWIFKIHFDRTYPADVAVFGADYFDMPVLMDGKVIPPRGIYQ